MNLRGFTLSQNSNDVSIQVAEDAHPNPSKETVRGRSIFLVETTTSGIAVQTSFLTEDGKLLQLPAIFPDAQYALTQIDELRNLVLQHFSKAAQVGAQVMAKKEASDADRPEQKD